jgi:N-acetylglucosaminyl-diphospho-decaprenol L-rhamnosyltransferase
VPTLSICIVSYRVRDLLAACLRSIEENGFARSWEVICVDNASGDGTVETVKPLFPAVRWLENRENIGFAPAVNQAAAEATGEYLLLLNPDGALITGALDRLVSFLEAHPDVGVVGPRLLLPDGTPYVSATKFPTAATILLYETRLNRLMPGSRILRPYGRQLAGTEPFPVDAVEGSCLMTRRWLWMQLGGFDSRYFFGVEELDFTWKVKRAGYGVWFHPEPGMIHRHSGSSGGTRKGTLVLLSVTLGILHFMQTNRAAAYALLRLPLLAVLLAKWIVVAGLGRVEQAVAFREAAKALLGVRPPWVTDRDRKKWAC